MKINVDHVAKLANLQIDQKEKDKLEKQLEETIEYVDELEKVDTKNVEPTSHVGGLENVFREDLVSDSLTQEEALSNAKEKYDGYFVVDAILDDQ